MDVELHPVAGIPPEYCEFLPKAEFEKCVPWLLQNRDATWLQANASNYAEFFADEKTAAVEEKLKDLTVAGTPLPALRCGQMTSICMCCTLVGGACSELRLRRGTCDLRRGDPGGGGDQESSRGQGEGFACHRRLWTVSPRVGSDRRGSWVQKSCVRVTALLPSAARDPSPRRRTR